jgi:nicotinamide-nucleotide amidase
MKSIRVEVVCVGSELLANRVNTHAVYLGGQLLGLGLAIAREHTVGDDEKLMEEVFRDAARRADVVICCGGLGPTYDDVTRDVWARVVKRPLRFQPDLLADIADKFRKRGLRMAPKNKRQAFLLTGAEVIPNPNGTAPGQYLRRGEKIFVLLPGPARELAPMMESFVAPRLRALFPGRVSREKSFHLIGVPESTVDHWVRPIVRRTARVNGCRVTHGILASQSIITVKFKVEGRSAAAVEGAVKRVGDQLRKPLVRHLFGEDGDTLESVVAARLVATGKTVATAESCTGGLIAKILTDQPGASTYFIEGLVTYANTSKERRVGVRRSTLRAHGAVSAEVAREMAAGLRRSAKTDFAISVTGVAGPAVGTPEKPVGLVYVGVAGPDRVRVTEFRFTGDRAWIRHRAALMALDILRQELG